MLQVNRSFLACRKLIGIVQVMNVNNFNTNYIQAINLWGHE